ncbi:HK97 family phage prohead protease [Occallatibacter riparius]|uniref:HK97 family phage prohead protease n=1 Tax=Occallatibacter riparius TaxID=1002689 RepID=A0A9J7BH38_9BACT|nr:HK97 family phage prohead protease [Occallatibacter riparius]UWZ81833.1 HK97 family phage prohead protease [Occallatibacter riparius]
MAKKIAGYAARFDSPSDDIGFIETIDHHAFDGVLRTKPDVLVLFNHDAHKLLGRTASGTARVSVDARGLLYSCDLPDTTVGRDVYELVKRGDVVGSSFGFVVAEDVWNVAPNGQVKRTILNLSRLIDCSPVVTPAYPSTSVTI